jgi:hypothetical protein
MAAPPGPPLAGPGAAADRPRHAGGDRDGRISAPSSTTWARCSPSLASAPAVSSIASCPATRRPGRARANASQAGVSPAQCWHINGSRRRTSVEHLTAGPRGHPSSTEVAGLGSDWVLREMRHTFVSLLSSDGMPLEDIADLVGHAGP